MEPKGEMTLFELIKPLKVSLTDEQVDILFILSDNKGYTATELKKMMKINYIPSNLLSQLSSPNFGNLEDSISIKSFHLKDPLALAHVIQDQRDPISKYIFKNMHETLLEDLTTLNLDLIAVFLAIGLDRILLDPNFYDEERFSDVKLSEGARKLIALMGDLKNGRIRFLNRILVEDAYPEYICKTRIPLILAKNEPGKSGNPYFLNFDLRTFMLIVEHLKDQIILDRNKLEEMKTRLKIELGPYRGLEKYFEKEIQFSRALKLGIWI